MRPGTKVSASASMGVSGMANIYRKFTDKRKREVRVTFDPDGTAYYCGYDLAAMSGYSAPTKVVQCSNTGLYPAESVMRNIEYIDSKKRGVRRFRCFDEENALKFLERKPAPQEVKDWFTSEVIPQVRKISLEIAAKLGREASPEEDTHQEQQDLTAALEGIGIKTFRPAAAVPSSGTDIMARLDAIILEAVLLKQEIQKIR